MEERVLERVRKMLRLANDAAASEGERDNALRMVHNILAKHNMTMAQIDMDGGAATDKRGNHAFNVADKMWQVHVAHAIAKLMFCEMYMNRAGKEIKLTLIGRDSNRVTAEEMTAYVISSIRKESGKFERENGGGRQSFNKGATARIAERCRILREEAERANAPETAASTGTALVLASVYSSEYEANRKHLAEVMNVKLGKAQAARRTRIDYGAYGVGHAFGGTVSLNRQLSGGGSKPTALIK